MVDRDAYSCINALHLPVFYLIIYPEGFPCDLNRYTMVGQDRKTVKDTREGKDSPHSGLAKTS